MNVVPSAHCSSTLVFGCSYWLPFSRADFTSLSGSLRTTELNDKLLLHTHPYAQLHRLPCKCYHQQPFCKDHQFPFRVFHNFLSSHWALCLPLSLSFKIRFNSVYLFHYCEIETTSTEHKKLYIPNKNINNNSSV